jgi:ParB family chromosome partitioning protein
VGRERSTVANLLRLLQLPPDVQALVHQKRLSAGHARALLGLSDAERQSALAAEAIDQEWSVREIEAAVAGKRTSRRPSKRAGGQPAVRGVTADVKRLEDALRKRLGTDIRVTARRRGRGFVTISYYSNDDLSRLLELILGGPFEG